jgi:RNA-directed DNA polymerase
MKQRVWQITSRNGGRSLSSVIAELRGCLVGWKDYFRLADTPRIFRELDTAAGCLESDDVVGI